MAQLDDVVASGEEFMMADLEHPKALMMLSRVVMASREQSKLLEKP